MRWCWSSTTTTRSPSTWSSTWASWGPRSQVRRNDAVDVAGVRALAPDRIVVSPGPGRPEDAGVSCELIRAAGRRGADPRRVPRASGDRPRVRRARGGGAGAAARQDVAVVHDGRGIFQGLTGPFEAGRYHSLVVAADPWPARARGRRACRRRRRGDGAAPPRVPAARRAVPSRVGAHRRRPADAAQLPGARLMIPRLVDQGAPPRRPHRGRGRAGHGRGDARRGPSRAARRPARSAWR